MDYLIAPEQYEMPEFVLRSYQPGDGSLINEAVSGSYEHLKPWMPWAKPETSLEESEILVRKWRGQYLLSQEFMIGIFSPSGDRQLGSTGFMLRGGTLNDLVSEIGMWIRVDAAGKGLGTRVLKAMLYWGFSEWPWQKLTWYCDERNLVSARTAQKAGMLKEGHFRSDAPLPEGGRRSTFMFAALREEWLEWAVQDA